MVTDAAGNLRAWLACIPSSFACCRDNLVTRYSHYRAFAGRCIVGAACPCCLSTLTRQFITWLSGSPHLLYVLYERLLLNLDPITPLYCFLARLRTCPVSQPSATLLPAGWDGLRNMPYRVIPCRTEVELFLLLITDCLLRLLLFKARVCDVAFPSLRVLVRNAERHCLRFLPCARTFRRAV